MRLHCAAAAVLIAHASTTLPRFASGSLSLEHWLGRDDGDGLSGSEGSVRDVHC